ncbi:hypothetical protein ACSTHH_23460, partial [Vibrio parahaemolyticus]
QTEVKLDSTTKESYPVSMAWHCRTRLPNSAPDCAVKLETKLDHAELEEGDTARLSVKVDNKLDRSHGMVTAIIGIPA